MRKVETKEFFEYLFEGLEGFLALAQIDRRHGNKTFKNKFFRFPDDLHEALIYIEKNKHQVDLYFAPFLTVKKRRKKHDIEECPVAWADGDTCPVSDLIAEPSIVIKTSEGKHSYLWKFKEIQPPEIAEDISKRIAYKHEADGMDKSGWDLTQLLRVPGTFNHKYTPPQEVDYGVIIHEQGLYEPDDFYADYPEVEDSDAIGTSYKDIVLPDLTPQQIFDKYSKTLNPRAYTLYSEVPNYDWSKALWELELTLAEGGLTAEEIFVVVEDSECNKYKRDNRPRGFMWQECQRAVTHVQKRETDPPPLEPTLEEDSLEAPPLLTEEERELVRGDRTFVEDYTEWAKTLGDAAPVYHPVGAFVILSTLIAANVKLPTSFGTVIPNLWFMILADTTLTRKSTAMDNAVDMLMEVDYDALLATDGSVEGLMTAMGTRPGRASMFLRDEVTGLIESLKKDYMAGMMETLTKLYDGKPLKRILRKETIDVRDPVLIMFAGGIRNKMIEILDQQHVTSGFLPRFIFVTAESDLTRLKPIGPPTATNKRERLKLLKRAKDMYERYSSGKASTDGSSVKLPKHWKAELDTDAWDLYNHYEVEMLAFAMDTFDPSMLTPMMDRLAKSGLKASVLLAASRMEKEEKKATVRVTKLDVLHAFYYIEQWMKHSLYMINNIGTSQDERKLKRVLHLIDQNPNGVKRSTIMQRYYLSAREADSLFNTLEQRNNIRREKRGSKAERVYPTV